MDKLEDMGWTPEEAAMMRRIDPAVRDRVLNLLGQQARPQQKERHHGRS